MPFAGPLLPGLDNGTPPHKQPIGLVPKRTGRAGQAITGALVCVVALGAHA